jgi:valyl-tRNA synthetase
LEWIKPEYGKSIDTKTYEKAVSFFDDLLQMLHPFMPFITEEIYHLLNEREQDLMVKQFAPVGNSDVEILLLGSKLKGLITSIREARNKHQIKPKEPVNLFIETGDEHSYDQIKPILLKQVNAASISFKGKPEAASIMLVIGKDSVYVESEKEIDKDAQREKLLKDLNYLKGFLISVDKKLSNDKFVQNAKPEVIELERKKKTDAEEKISIIRQSLSSLE